MKKYFSLVLTVILSISIVNNCFSQEISSDLRSVTIETVDGLIIKGKIVSQTRTYLKLKTNSAGIITIEKSKIKSIENGTVSSEGQEIEGNKLKEYPSKYFLGGSAYNLNRGEAYYANTGIFFNEIIYGVTNNFSIGAGVIPLFLFNGSPTPLWFKAKLSYPIVENKINISGGFIAGSIFSRDEIEDIGIIGAVYGIATFGSKHKNVSIGINYAFGDRELSPPIITLNGKAKISKRTFLISDNFIYIDNSGYNRENSLISILGARTLFKGIALDYGGIIPIGDGLFEGLFIYPYLGIKIRIGRK